MCVCVCVCVWTATLLCGNLWSLLQSNKMKSRKTLKGSRARARSGTERVRGGASKYARVDSSRAFRPYLRHPWEQPIISNRTPAHTHTLTHRTTHTQTHSCTPVMNQWHTYYECCILARSLNSRFRFLPVT